ncbi:pilus assembly protein [Desertihabitans brevis]|uniref:Pilus assembly protein n=1 Tax=Desertihabitans brevis TaxID=2268447 RepID=A0A367YX99_9ACTN|nr:TadE family protein [Desertihabitans brevis]RCK70450.1 pilus assembly protein [Desertihabitans brevis]
MTRPSRGERGVSESVQWALVVPVLLTTLLAVIQLGVWVHGRNTVRHAAVAGAEAAAVADSSASRSRAEQAAGEVTRAGGLHSVQVRVRSTDGRVEVTTTAQVDLVVDLGLGRVSGTANVPREQLT